MKSIVFVFGALLTLLPSAVVLAQGGGQNSGGIKIPNPLSVDSITGLFVALLDILIIFAVPIIAFFIIYAGFLYVTARGNTDQVGQAHRALLYAVIGGVLVLGAGVLIEVIEGTVDAVRR